MAALPSTQAVVSAAGPHGVVAPAGVVHLREVGAEDDVVLVGADDREPVPGHDPVVSLSGGPPAHQVDVHSVSAAVPEAHLVPIRAATEVVRVGISAGIEYVAAATAVEGVTVGARLFLAVVDPVLLPEQVVAAGTALQAVGTGATADQVVAAAAVDDIVSPSGDDHVAVRRSDDVVVVSGADDGGLHAVAGRVAAFAGPDTSTTVATTRRSPQSIFMPGLMREDRNRFATTWNLYRWPTFTSHRAAPPPLGIPLGVKLPEATLVLGSDCLPAVARARANRPPSSERADRRGSGTGRNRPDSRRKDAQSRGRRRRVIGARAPPADQRRHPLEMKGSESKPSTRVKPWSTTPPGKSPSRWVGREVFPIAVCSAFVFSVV